MVNTRIDSLGVVTQTDRRRADAHSRLPLRTGTDPRLDTVYDGRVGHEVLDASENQRRLRLTKSRPRSIAVAAIRASGSLIRDSRRM